MPLEVTDPRGPSPIVRVLGKRRTDENTRQSKNGRRTQRSNNAENIGQPWPRPPPYGGGAGEGNAERRSERIEQDVREARIATRDHELEGLHSQRKKGAQRDSAPRTPARDAQCRPQRQEQRRVQDAVGERPVAAQHTEERRWSVRGLER